MRNRVHNSPNLIYSVGTQVVALKMVQGSHGNVVHPDGAVGVVVRSPVDRKHAYRVRFVDAFEAPLHHDSLMLLAEYKEGTINDSNQVLSKHGLFDRVIYRCIVGSRAFGLNSEDSDYTDLEFHEAEYERLVTELRTAADECTLPERPTGRDALSDLLVRLRMETARD